MIRPEVRAEMRRLVLGEGWKIETVARRFGVHHSVVRRAISDQPPPEHKPAAPSGLDPFKPYLLERLSAYPEMTAKRLFEEIHKRGYPHGIAVLRRWLVGVRAPRSKKAYLRIELEPGEQAQVDWGSFGQMRCGATLRPLSVFAMVMSWSRALFLDFALDQRMETFLLMHRRALEFFGGVPRKILYDNLKSAVLHHIGSTVQFNPRLLALAGHYLFEPAAAPVRYPEAKGRVEGAIKYIRHSFFYGRSFRSLDDVRSQAAQWRDQVANDRVHATTHERPRERLLVEAPRLRALPPRPFDTDAIVPAIVSKEARVRFDANSYSVPPAHVGKSVMIRASDTSVRVIADGIQIARHDRCFDRRRAIEDPAHLAAIAAHKGKGALSVTRKDRIANLAPEARLYLQEIARRRIDLESEIQKLLRLVARYGETEVAGGMAKALAARTFGVRYVRALIDQARFARGLGEPPEPIVTGHHAADSLDVTPHDLETYDALFPQVPKTAPKTSPQPSPPNPAQDPPARDPNESDQQ
jgi:transposase